MRAPSRISGPHLRLRPVTEADAAFIHGLRTDPAHNRHLSPVTGTVVYFFAGMFLVCVL
jgi:hypothetical protein